MSYECFDVSVRDRVAHVILNRPEKRNSMIPAFWDELPKIIRDLDSNARARVAPEASGAESFAARLRSLRSPRSPG